MFGSEPFTEIQIKAEFIREVDALLETYKANDFEAAHILLITCINYLKHQGATKGQLLPIVSKYYDNS